MACLQRIVLLAGLCLSPLASGGHPAADFLKGRPWSGEKHCEGVHEVYAGHKVVRHECRTIAERIDLEVFCEAKYGDASAKRIDCAAGPRPEKLSDATQFHPLLGSFNESNRKGLLVREYRLSRIYEHDTFTRLHGPILRGEALGHAILQTRLPPALVDYELLASARRDPLIGAMFVNAFKERAANPITGLSGNARLLAAHEVWFLNRLKTGNLPIIEEILAAYPDSANLRNALEKGVDWSKSYAQTAALREHQRGSPATRLIVLGFDRWQQATPNAPEDTAWPVLPAHALKATLDDSRADFETVALAEEKAGRPAAAILLRAIAETTRAIQVTGPGIGAFGQEEHARRYRTTETAGSRIVIRTGTAQQTSRVDSKTWIERVATWIKPDTPETPQLSPEVIEEARRIQDRMNSIREELARIMPWTTAYESAPSGLTGYSCSNNTGYCTPNYQGSGQSGSSSWITGKYQQQQRHLEAEMAELVDRLGKLEPRSAPATREEVVYEKKLRGSTTTYFRESQANVASFAGAAVEFTSMGLETRQPVDATQTHKYGIYRQLKKVIPEVVERALPKLMSQLNADNPEAQATENDLVAWRHRDRVEAGDIDAALRKILARAADEQARTLQ